MIVTLKVQTSPLCNILIYKTTFVSTESIKRKTKTKELVTNKYKKCTDMQPESLKYLVIVISGIGFKMMQNSKNSLENERKIKDFKKVYIQVFFLYYFLKRR